MARILNAEVLCVPSAVLLHNPGSYRSLGQMLHGSRYPSTIQVCYHEARHPFTSLSANDQNLPADLTPMQSEGSEVLGGSWFCFKKHSIFVQFAVENLKVASVCL